MLYSLHFVQSSVQQTICHSKSITKSHFKLKSLSYQCLMIQAEPLQKRRQSMIYFRQDKFLDILPSKELIPQDLDCQLKNSWLCFSPVTQNSYKQNVNCVHASKGSRLLTALETECFEPASATLQAPCLSWALSVLSMYLYGCSQLTFYNKLKDI